MDDINDSRWNVASNRPQRANRGSMLQTLLEKGLNSDEEKLLNNLSDATSDSTFSASDEAVDEIDSDFSDEEVEGVLDGATVVTDAMLMREDRLERKKERQRATRHGNPATRGGTAGAEKVMTVRLRPRPSIPLEERLQAAHERAKEVRAMAARRANAEDRVARSAVTEREVTAKRGRNRHSRGRELQRNDGEKLVATEKFGEEVAQRVRYTSSASVLEQYGVPVVISFSKCLPPMFTTGAVMM